ncbi:MAG: type III pantothenate kinase [Actinobacteria bacterium]|nr:type III pantothenate kinase [Actinomycetota bacterium]
MLLAIDVGNTHTVIGLFEDDDILATWRLGTPKYRYETADEIGSILLNFLNNSGYDALSVEEIAISSVVPRMLEEIKKMSMKYFKCEPFIINSSVKTGLKIIYDYPMEVGSDRIANSIAAKKLYGFPAIVADFGTATTFDIVSDEGNYIGGVITPGIEISSEALFKYAAKLSKVDLSWPEKIIGKNTYDGLRSGILFGFLGQVDYIIEKIIEEEKNGKEDFNPLIIGTGGLSYLLKNKSKYIKIFDDDLTLKGIKILNDMNKIKKEDKC